MSVERDANPEVTASGRVVELGSLILRHKVVIGFMSIVGIALGYLYYVKTPPVYGSSCSLFIHNTSNMSQIPFQGIESQSGTTQREQPHATLLATPMIVNEAFNFELTDDLQLKKTKDGLNIYIKDEERTHDKITLHSLPAFRGMVNPTAFIIQHLTSRPSMQNNIASHEIINVTFTNTDPEVAKIVLDCIVASYQHFLGETQQNYSKEVLELIETAEYNLSEKIRIKVTEYGDFRQETPLLFNGEIKMNGDTKTGNIHKERMKEIEIARAKVAILATERKAELQSIKQALLLGGSREAITLMLKTLKPESRGNDSGEKNPAVEIFEAMLEEQMLLLEHGQEHPKVKAVQRKIALMQDWQNGEGVEMEKPAKRKRSDFLSVCMDALQHEINSIDSKIMELDELFEAERDASKAIAVYEFTDENFKKELERMETLYQRIVKRLEELNLLKEYGGYKTAIISPPSIGRHVSPVLSKSLLFGALFGAIIGLALSYAAEASDTTFRTPEEVSEYLNLPIIGHIPVIAHEATEIGVDSRLDSTLIAYFKPKSRQAESYRAIRTSLYFSTRAEQHKVIQISSPNPGDGKTTLSANLAISIAQSGKKVLLIDADFRRPRVHELFGLEKSGGMSSVISGDVELPDAIQATEVENLWALPCGDRPNNPCELLTSRRFEELLAILRDQYDFVIVDTPPLLAVTDPGAVAPRVDAVILTIRLTNRTRGEAMRATQLLAELGGNILGVVVNGVGTNSRRGYGYGYGNYGGYGGYGAYQYRYNSKYEYGSEQDNPYYSDDGDDSRNERTVSITNRRNRGLKADR